MLTTINELSTITPNNPTIWRFIFLGLCVDFKFIPHAPNSLDVISLIV